MQDSVLELASVSKVFTSGDSQRTILRDACFSMSSGEVISFIGRSGLGKSTVLQICGLLDFPSSGEVLICGNACVDENFATFVRRKDIDFVYQFHYLLTEFNVVENIMLPLIINGCDKKSAKVKSINMLEKMSLGHLVDLEVSQLSGGEKQRVAVIRGMIHNPKIVIADEPTGNLDPESAEMVFSLLIEFAKVNKSSLLVATHNIDLAKKADYAITIDNEKIVEVTL